MALSIDTMQRVQTSEDGFVIRRAVIACTVGQVFEIYDFVVYGFMAAAIAKAFFPPGDAVAALLNTFATFAIGFLFRPLGGFVIGSFGDRFGRRQALVVTISMMAIATGLIGIIPDYASIGVFAPAILVICRALQGFSTGGEWSGAAAFLVEHAPMNNRGFISSFQQVGSALGLLLGSLVAGILNYGLDAQSFASWGWRIPFLLGFVLGPIGHYLRTRVAETPAFSQMVASEAVPQAPLREAFLTQKANMLVVFTLSMCPCVLYFIFLVYLPTFAQQQLGISPSAALFSTTLAGFIYLAFTPLFGALSDRTGRKPLFFISAFGIAILGYPLFSYLVWARSVVALLVVQGTASIIFVFGSGVFCALLSEIFPTRIRYTALSVSYGLSVAIFGGLSALIATALIRLTGDLLSPSYYVIVSGLLSAVATLFVIERSGMPLPK
jgi:MFS transporter, MHS family, proline/betaine transporter